MRPPGRRDFLKFSGSWERFFDRSRSAHGTYWTVCWALRTSGAGLCHREGRIWGPPARRPRQYDRNGPPLSFILRSPHLRQSPFPPQSRHRTHAGQYESPPGESRASSLSLWKHSDRFRNSGKGFRNGGGQSSIHSLPVPPGKEILRNLSGKGGRISAKIGKTDSADGRDSSKKIVQNSGPFSREDPKHGESRSRLG